MTGFPGYLYSQIPENQVTGHLKCAGNSSTFVKGRGRRQTESNKFYSASAFLRQIKAGTHVL